ncbi:hypothetical protein [Actinomadura sp. 21ATH]|uniref:hypothetical protein n=1 Tax=Actinomadura sp. 21ATH TaxID=1735444 RepID=UPI0035BF6F15
MTQKRNDWVVRWPTLGFLAADWIAQHCIVPDRFAKGDPFELYDWQLWCTVNHYRVRPAATVGQLAPAFQNRRSQVVAPQKTGKGPWSASVICLEARGPAVFDGWAEGGEAYVCAQHGCDCGWMWEYEPGDPMGIPWPTPLIQLLATSEDQVANVYRPLQAMVKGGPLGEQMKVGENFIRIGDEGRIDVVTSSAQSRLGNPITFALQDETGLYNKTNKMIRVAETQRRGLAGMGGRSMETTNAWDPSEGSVAQRTAEAQVKDVFRFHELPPAGLSYTDKRERRRIHRHVYAGSAHVDLDAIEAEAAELLLVDPAQAERFFGNRIVSGSDAWMRHGAWEARTKPREVPVGAPVVLGFDGSDTDDWTAIRLETLDGYQFTPTYADGRPTIWNPADRGGQVPRLEVDAAMEEVMASFNVVRGYLDPPYWESECDAWVDRYGEKVMIRWYTWRPAQMHAAAERLLTDVVKVDSTFAHDGCPITAQHVANTRKKVRPGGRYVLDKASDPQKIDACVTSIIVHEAAGDAVAAGLNRVKKKSYVYTSSML